MTKDMRPLWFKVEGVVTASNEEDGSKKLLKLLNRSDYLSLDTIVFETPGKCLLHPGTPLWPEVGCSKCAKEYYEKKKVL